MWIAASPETIKTPTYVALGNFDGIHRGHRQVIQPIFAAVPPALATVVTFSPHPQVFFTGHQRLLLTPQAEKVDLLQAIGVEQLVLLPFNQTLASLTPEAFVDVVLVQQLGAKRVSVGQDFCFGRNRSGTTEDLQRIGNRLGIEVEIAQLHLCGGERISSSAIRRALSEGQVERANQLLGRPYRLVGEVAHGQQLGRTIGFPTANLNLPPEKFLPRQGVYSVWVSGADLGGTLPGVMNIGMRPTVNGKQQTIEVHLLDWSGDLYGKTLSVSLERFIRAEQKFASLEDLKAQIQADSETARSHLLQLG